MKKKLLTLCLLVCMSLGIVGGGITAFADVSLEECDLCFQQTVNSILEETEVDGNSIVTQRRPLYDLKLQGLGCVYSFETALGEGYAVVICDNGNYVAQEFVKSSASPYAEVSDDELCVYAYTMTYLKSVDGQICDIKTSTPLSEEAVNSLGEIAVFYHGDADTDYVKKTVRIDFASYTYDTKTLCLGTPRYFNSGWTSGCAAVAGGNLIGYYDRFYEDLIPNHAAGRSSGDLFIYYFEDDYVNSMISTLYTEMKGSADGITEADFISGMKKYCSGKSLSCDFTSLKSGNSINYNSVKDCINGGYPLVLFLNTYTICRIANYETFGEIFYEIHSGNHVMPGFGYSSITYTLNDGSKSEYKFINVSTGWSDPREAYFNIEYCTNIVSAYKVNIH
ncbi:MAG: hypothetical protein K2N14_02555 [Clostridia bacterium]|nr:hypothetical protein [Clostridia bacterium]